MKIDKLDDRTRATVQNHRAAPHDARDCIADREWFTRHPDRSTYARAPLQGETVSATPAGNCFVAVRHLGGGRLLHQFFRLNGDLAKFSNDLAACVASAIDRKLDQLSEGSEAFPTSAGKDL